MDPFSGKEEQLTVRLEARTKYNFDFFLVLDYDSASKALSAMCEIASEACQTWFPTQEK